ncbi:MAG: CoA pyrophosphatase [Burkholderiaceae bacterium]
MAAPLFDPTALPIHAISSDPAIAAAILTAPRLREAFRDPRAWEPEPIEDRLARRRETPLVQAAVLMPVVVRDSQLSVLLTERTAHLHDHAGQVSFPGGRSEAEDGSAVETALRETQEEIGLGRDRIEVIGMLPDYLTGTGYRVTPVVGLVSAPFELKADPFEVAEVFEVPLQFLMDPANHQTRRLVLESGERLFYAMPFGRHFIWGATAGMLRNFYRFLSAQIEG